MRKKRVIESALKEIRRDIKDWSDDKFNGNFVKQSLSFAKFVPSDRGWEDYDQLLVTISWKKVNESEEERVRESTLGTEEGGACTHPAKHQAEIKAEE